MRKVFLMVVLALAVCLVAAGDASACCCWGCCGWSCCGGCCWSCCSPCCGSCYGCGPCCYTNAWCIDYFCYAPPGSLYSPYGFTGTYYYANVSGRLPPHLLMAHAKATVTVILPADAKLTANGQQTTTTSDRRVFVTPELESGKVYSYVMTMTVERDGKTVEETRKVLVRAGEESKVTFETPAVATASK